jgi:WD40 repeat protein
MVRVWDARTGARLWELSGHAGGVLSVAFSPDGRLLATGGGDGIVRVWDVPAGNLSRWWSVHNRGVWTIAFSPDGRWLATGGDEAPVRVWDAHSGVEAYAALPLANGGYATLIGDLAYKLDGEPSGEFWYVINMVRLEPGELDPYLHGPQGLPAEHVIIDSAV